MLLLDATRAYNNNHSERSHRSEDRRHKKTLAAGQKAPKASCTGADRGSWIEDVVKNSMRDVAHRYEAQRIRKISGPVSRGPPLVIHKGTHTRKHTRRRTRSAPSAIVCVRVSRGWACQGLLLLLLWKSSACHASTCAFLFFRP
jgi:hypothetical protein